jgi:tetraacyldisaccharide 4'-kinase
MSARRPVLWPLVAIYRLAVAANDTAYRRGWLRVRRLPRPVISVGSISAGGAGKTPFVIALARLHEELATPVDILTRGYRRTSTSVEAVIPDAPDASSRFGDEPVELAQAGLQVFVGSERYDAGLLAENTNQLRGHLLDDGFQHRLLARDLDIVLLTAEDAADSLLPAGNLREPLAALARADIVVLRENEADALRPIVTRQTTAEVWFIRRELVIPTRFDRPFAFCGIARPAGFFKLLGPLAGTLTFPDHHPYTRADIQWIAESASTAGADGIYFTEKDAVKLSPELLQILESVAPVSAPYLQVSILDSESAKNRLRGVFQG